MAMTGDCTHAGSTGCPGSRPMLCAWQLLPPTKGQGGALRHDAYPGVPGGLCALKHKYHPCRQLGPHEKDNRTMYIAQGIE